MATTLVPKQREAGNGLELYGTGTSFNDELYEMIERVQLFQGLARSDVKILANYVQAYRAQQGATLFHEGQKGDSLYIVIKGRIDLFKEAGPKEYKKIHTVRGGKTMGEMSLLDGLPYSASAVAAEPSVLLLFTKLRWERLQEEQPVVALKAMNGIAKLMSLRLRQTTGILLDYLE